MYQISKERERIQEESTNGEGAYAADINTRAYENVKNTWTKRRIWNGRWGTLPGMSWKHEEPIIEEPTNDPVLVPSNPPAYGSYDGSEAPSRRICGSTSPITSNHHETSETTGTSQQGPSADVISAKLENCDTKRSPPASNLSRPRTDKRVGPVNEQTLWPNRKQPSHKDGHLQPVADAFLGPAH